MINDLYSSAKIAYNRQQHNPGIAGIAINPFYLARRRLNQNILPLIKRLYGKVLDIGCGQKPYQAFIEADEYIGLELDTPENRAYKKADFFYDGKAFPFAGNEFDCLLSNQVLEHVFNPYSFLKEANRVLKKDGLFLLSVPFVWDEHEQPYDFARYSIFGLKHIFQQSGFEMVETRKSCSGIEAIFQLMGAYLFKIIQPQKTIVNMFFTMFFICPVTIAGLIWSRILPANEELYLDNVVLVRKIHDV